MTLKLRSKAFALFALMMSVTMLVCAFTLEFSIGHSKSIRYPIAKEYDFVRYDLNRIDLYGSSNQWNDLLADFSTLAFEGKGKIDIVHIGGSHVQGGFLSDRLRSNLVQLMYGAEGERGFVFPYQLAKTNSPRSVKCEFAGTWQGCRNAVADSQCDWGMSGINASTNDPDARFQVTTLHLDSIPHPFQEIRIYSSAGDSSSYDLQVTNAQLDSTSLSLTYRRYVYTDPQTSAEVSLHKTDSLQNQFHLQGLYFGKQDVGISYHTIGVNGASTRSYLRCEEFGQQFATIAPRLVVCGIGVNDANVPSDEFDAAQFEARYDSLIATFKQANPRVCLLFVTNNDTYYQKKYSNPNALKIRQSMISLATKHGGAVYDLYSIMGGENSIRTWANAGLAANDYVHFSKRGYELQADMMTAAFAELLGHYISKPHP
jgi:lysophospholipase L1-like esterase